MDENISLTDETIDMTDTDEIFEDSEDSVIGKVILGGAAVAAGIAAGFAVKNREKIKEKIAARKEARRVKKVEKLMEKLNKLAPVENPSEAEKAE